MRCDARHAGVVLRGWIGAARVGADAVHGVKERNRARVLSGLAGTRSSRWAAMNSTGWKIKEKGRKGEGKNGRVA